MSSKVIINCIKGIKELEISCKVFEKIKDSKVIGIYGPNGAGKSSLKNGLLNKIGEVRWGCKKPKKHPKIDPELILNNYGVFDENLVELIKGNVNKITFLGLEVRNLFELLTQRDEVLESEVPGLINLDFFKSNNDELKKYSKKIKILKSILITANELVKFKFSSLVEKQRLIINTYKEFIKKFEDFSIGLFEGYISHNKNTNLHHFNGRSHSNHGNIIAKALDDFSIGEYNPEANESLINYINEIIKILDNFYMIKNNFGYKNEDRKLEYDFPGLLNLDSDKFSFSNNVGSLGLEIKKFIEFFSNSKDAKMINFSRAWNKILKSVTDAAAYANKILSLYDLGYKIQLTVNTIDDQNKSNLELLHLNSNTPVKQEDIFKKVSYGELNIISFCLFVASFLKRRDISKNYQLVFDDPISSYDLNKINITISILQKIMHENNKIDKMYILSHEKHFISEVKKYFSTCVNHKKEHSLETKECFESELNKSWFFLEKVNNKHTLKEEDMDGDLMSYAKLTKSSQKRTKLISIRVIMGCIKIIAKELRFKELSEQKEREAINSIVDKFMENFAISKGHSIKAINSDIKNNNININMNDLNKINKEDLYSIRNNYEEKFINWLNKQNESLTLDNVVDIKNQKNFTIFKSLIYIRLLNRISHSEEEILNVNLSKSTEIADILFSNKEDLIETLNKSYEFYLKK